MKEKAESRKNIYGLLATLYGQELTAEQISLMKEQKIFATLKESGWVIDLNQFEKWTPRILKRLGPETLQHFSSGQANISTLLSRHIRGKILVTAGAIGVSLLLNLKK